jgi:3-methyladenine DNA glycosylase AlkD
MRYKQETMSATARPIIRHLKRLSNPTIAAQLQWFFKTGPGEYGEGDKFLGIKVPTLRKCAQEYRQIALADALALLKTPLHEARMLALFILVDQHRKGTEDERETLYRAYLRHARYINNWDLVDCSAPYIVGAHLSTRNRKPLFRLARSRNLWERRIAIVSTAYFIRDGDLSDTLAIAKLLLRDEEDLIHKATGWMLREVGKRNLATEESFLIKHYKKMPRTMLRYAIEKFPEAKRQAYLQGSR